MKSKKNILIFAGIALIALSIVFGISYAINYLSIENSTVNYVNTKKLAIKVIEEYEPPTDLYPSNEVDKVVNVQNTGDVDVLLRVKVEKVWGASRDENGNLIVDSSLSGDNITFVANTDYWKYDSDGYYYYKGLLAPDTLTREPLFKEYVIDPLKTTNEYQGMFADIIVTAEAIQYASTAVTDAWGKTYSFFDVEAPVEPVSEKTTVTFNSPSEQFDIRYTHVDLFANFKDLYPGTSRTQVIEVKNNYTKVQGIYLKAEATGTNTELAQEMLEEYIYITIKNGNDIVYYGPASGNLNASSGDTMRSYLPLGDFQPGEVKDLVVTLTVDKAMDNRYQELLGSVRWWFHTTYVEPTVIVHHYLFGSTMKLADDETIIGTLNWPYETSPSEKLIGTYDITGYPDNNPVNYPENWKGYFTDDIIHVYYYYKLVHADFDTDIDKTGDIEVEGPDAFVDYVITYNVDVRAYKGKAIITIVDYLPCSIYEDSILDGGLYDPVNNTITWRTEVDVDTYVNGETILTYVKHPSIHYTDNDRVLRNVATGTVEFVETGETDTVEDDHVVNDGKYGRVIVHHYLENTETRLADDVTVTGAIGSQYETEPVSLNDYELVATPVNATGEFTKEDIIVIYYYRSTAPISPDTGDNLMIYIATLVSASVVLGISIFVLVKEKKKSYDNFY